MSDYRSLEKQFAEVLASPRRAVAVSFLDSPPAGVPAFAGTVPSGCSFWRLAAQGGAFYTIAQDHYNCPVGSYTNNFALPQERAAELTQTLSLMSDIGYIRMEEIPDVFKLPQTPAVVLYAPLGETPVDPAVVLFAGRPARLMLLMEAAGRAGLASKLPMLGRPTCMAIPASLSEGTVLSAGCIGNRIYTELGEDELYAAIPGAHLNRLAQELGTITAANAALTQYHQGRLPLLVLK